MFKFIFQCCFNHPSFQFNIVHDQIWDGYFYVIVFKEWTQWQNFFTWKTVCYFTIKHFAMFVLLKNVKVKSDSGMMEQWFSGDGDGDWITYPGVLRFGTSRWLQVQLSLSSFRGIRNKYYQELLGTWWLKVRCLLVLVLKPSSRWFLCIKRVHKVFFDLATANSWDIFTKMSLISGGGSFWAWSYPSLRLKSMLKLSQNSFEPVLVN